MVSLINQYSDQQFIQIVMNSQSLKEIAKKIGYNSFSGALSKKIKDRIDILKISTQHFSNNKITTKRTQQNIFITNSTASQKTLRDWYRRGQYTEYKCSICGQEPIWQEKELTLILDHINGINNDDRLENLRWVCPNCNQQLETTNGKNRLIIKKKYYCIDCGKQISKNAIRCIECSHKLQQKVDRPSREELKNLIRNKTFTQIAKQYQVSDNAIRKWCDNYNLPRKARDIKNISDIDWQKI